MNEEKLKRAIKLREDIVSERINLDSLGAMIGEQKGGNGLLRSSDCPGVFRAIIPGEMMIAVLEEAKKLSKSRLEYYEKCFQNL